MHWASRGGLSLTYQPYQKGQVLDDQDLGLENQQCFERFQICPIPKLSGVPNFAQVLKMEKDATIVPKNKMCVVLQIYEALFSQE